MSTAGLSCHQPRMRRCPSTCSSVSMVSSFAVPSPRPNCTYSELRGNLVNLLSSKFCDVLRAFANFDPCCQGYVLPAQARRVLGSFLFSLTQEQFEALIKTEGQCDCYGRVNYPALLQRLTGRSRSLGLTGPVFSQATTDELENLLKDKIEKNLKNIMKAVVLFDYARDGCIQRSELREVIENYCFKMTDGQFDKLWLKHDLNRNGIISYGNFLMRMGIDANLAKKYIPCNSPVHQRWDRKAKYERLRQKLQATRQPMIECPDDPSFRGKTPDQICEIIKGKLQEIGKGNIVIKGCEKHDPSSTGFICIEDFHGVLNQFVIPMSRGTLEYLLKKCYPRENTRQIFPYRDFAYSYCSTQQFNQQDRNPFNVTHTPILKRVKRTIEKIKRHTIDVKSELIRNMNAITYCNARIFPRMELRKALEKLKINLHEDELRDLYVLLDPSNKNMIKVESFLDMFDEPQTRPEEEFVVRELMRSSKPRGYPSLNGEEFVAKLRSYASRACDHILATLQRWDERGDGRVPQRVLREVLEEFCFGMTDDQWQCLVKGQITSGEDIYYQPVLIVLHRSLEDDTDRYLRNVGKLLKHRYLGALPPETMDPERQVREWMVAYCATFLKDCTQRDLSRTGSLPKDVFRQLLNHHILRLSPHQFDILWRVVPKDRSGGLDYREFSEQFSAPKC